MHCGTLTRSQEVEAYCARVSLGFRQTIPDAWPSQLRSLVAECWAQDDAERPTAKDVVARLQVGVIMDGCGRV